MTHKLLSPCENCPWRKDASTDTIPNFDPCLMQNLLRQCSDDGLKIMACHKSTEDANVICAGFALQVGFDSSHGQECRERRKVNHLSAK